METVYRLLAFGVVILCALLRVMHIPIDDYMVATLCGTAVTLVARR